MPLSANGKATNLSSEDNRILAPTASYIISLKTFSGFQNYRCLHMLLFQANFNSCDFEEALDTII